MIQWYGPHLTVLPFCLIQDIYFRNWINEGPIVRELESRIAKFIGVKYAISVTNGTSAIALSLMASGIGNGDEVITSDLTFAATPNAIILAGAKPILVDIEAKNFGIDSRKIEAAITPKTKAVVVVDVNGRGINYQGVSHICAAHNLKLICDSAEGFGSQHHGRKLGTFGLAACFSFSANKIITSGQGGCVVTNDEKLHNRLRELKDQGRCNGGTGGDDWHLTFGANFKYTDLQAAVLLPQLEEIERRLQVAKHRDEIYRSRLSKINGIELPKDNGETLQWADALFDNRAIVIAELEQNSMGCRAFWHPIHRQKPYKDDDMKFPVSCDISKRGLWLPSRLDMSEDTIHQVCDVIIGALNG